ncbi:glutathione transferase [Pseudomonas vanderleydeniana]|uniref:Glutathione transferase n=1 Tax=Pseudomonas vanderleydeniana TaxID=2745495 RepID=A0A9E6TU86_9PSED|nr:glutathione transferase [Pseudomonas vanderleydeniana]QXI30599.1 glutathione transferase [Pseudomonas vanderleydeniana]
MNNARLRLYVDAQYTSPYALSVFVALREKALEFDLQPLDLDAHEQQAQGYAGLSLTQRVPTLEQGGFALSESSAITEYLEEQFAQAPIYPRDARQRARVRQVQAWLRSDLQALRQERSTLVIFYGQKAGPLSAAGEAAARKLIEAAQLLLGDGREYLCGQWSIADIDLALMLNRLILNGDPVPAGLVDYARRQWQHPAVQEWLALSRPALG